MNDTEFEQRMQALLEHSTASLDGRVRSRLTQARYAALEARRSRAALAWRNWMPLGAAAASAIVVLLLWSGRGALPSFVTAEPQATFEDMDLLADKDAMDLASAEDYEFYEWAAGEAGEHGAEAISS
jgi:hypothetical protein